MAFSWKLFNELDKESVDKLSQTVQNIKKNHELIGDTKFTDLSAEDEKALQDLIKKYKKSLDNVITVLSEFDQELEKIVKRV